MFFFYIVCERHLLTESKVTKDHKILVFLFMKLAAIPIYLAFARSMRQGTQQHHVLLGNTTRSEFIPEVKHRKFQLDNKY